MIKQNKKTASEHPNGISPITTRLISKLPSLIALDAEEFLKNNEKHAVKGHYCLSCLKAHLIRKIKERNIQSYQKIVEKTLSEPTGHNGYYMDGEELLTL